MALTVTHTTPADGTFSVSGATAWNAAHSITGSISTSLDGITAAVGAATIAYGNNTGIVWNWANTANTTVAFTLGETTAATNGTSTSGVPNQVLLKLATVSASTQSPLSVYSRGSHVFSVSPTAAQILGTNGSGPAPTYSFSSATNTGMAALNGLDFLVGGSIICTMVSGQARFVAGTSTLPSVSDQSNATTGLFFGANFMGVGDSTSGEIIRCVGGTANVGYTTRKAVAFANLPAAANGSELYCSDCDEPSLVDTTCTSAGTKTGAFAKRLNGAWKCS